jgi:hypothetical protein
MYCMSKNWLFFATLRGQPCWTLVAQALFYCTNCVQVVLLSLSMMPRVAICERSRLRTVGPRTGMCHRCWPLFEGVILWQGVALYHQVYRFCIYVYIFAAKTLCTKIWTSKFVIFFIFRALGIYVYIVFIFFIWFVCVYLWIFASSRILRHDPG